MVTVLALLGVLGVLFAAAVLSTREQGLLAEASPDATDVPLPADPLTPDDVGRLRFSMAARGYRMSEVDVALERLAEELADRDRRIGRLEAAARSRPEPVAPVREVTPRDLPVPADRVVPAVVVAPQPASEPEPAPVEPAPVEPAPAEPALAEPALAEPALAEPALSSRPAEPLPAHGNAGDVGLSEPPAPAQPAQAPAQPAQAPAQPAQAPAQPAQAPAQAFPAAFSSPARPAAWSSPSAVPAFPIIDAPETYAPSPQPAPPREPVAEEHADDRTDLDDRPESDPDLR